MRRFSFMGVLGVVTMMLVGTLPSVAHPVVTREAQAPAGFAPTVRSAERVGQSVQLRSLARSTVPLDSTPPRTERLQIPLRAHDTLASTPGPDPLRQYAGALTEMPAPIMNFEGVSSADNQVELSPPDTMGEVGPNHYMQWVNLSLAIWDKQGQLLLGPLPGNMLWQGFGGLCEANNDGDPIVLYDELADRWMISQFALDLYADAGFHQCIAISQTPDPTGAWYLYDFLYSATLLNDYPKFGVWHDAYYMTANQFDGSSFDFRGAGAVAFERKKMLLGDPTARMIVFDLQPLFPNAGGLLPADSDGLPPSTNTPGLFMRFDDHGDTDQLFLWEFHTDWNDPTRSTFGLDGQPTITIPVAPFDPNMCGGSRSCIPQPNTYTQLDAISDFIMYRLQYRNFGAYSSLVTSHTVDVDGNDTAGVRWYELRNPGSGWNLYQQGTFAPADGLQRWMSSAALDASGNLALGYSTSSSTSYPAIRYAGRLASEPLGQLGQGEVALIEGGGSQYESNRWGDYSMLTVDPVDQCTFWFTSEYYPEDGAVSWHTRIGSFRFPLCTSGPSGTLAGTVRDASNNEPISEVQVAIGAASITTDAQGAFRFAHVPVGTYTLTSHRYGYVDSTPIAVTISENMTTTQQLRLTALPHTTVRGTIVDGTDQGWPLYAQVSIVSEGFRQDLFSDPVTGVFSGSLVVGAPHTVAVHALVDGYLPVSQVVTPTTAAAPLAINLPIDETCRAAGYIDDRAFFNSYDSWKTFLPTISRGAISDTVSVQGGRFGGAKEGFSEAEGPQQPPTPERLRDTSQSQAVPLAKSVISTNGNFEVVGDTTSWEWGASSTITSHSGLNMWGTGLISGTYRSNEFGAIRSPIIDLSRYQGRQLWLGWWQVLRTERGYDYASVEISSDAGQSWYPIYGPVSGEVSTTWTPQRLLLPEAYLTDQFQLQFKFESDNSIEDLGFYVDDVVISAGCKPQAGGLVVGHVRDANTDAPLNAATIAVGSNGSQTKSFATPDDQNRDDGLFILFVPEGNAQAVAAGGLAGYATATTVVSITQRTLQQRTFRLDAGLLTPQPAGVHVTTTLGLSLTVPLTLTNSGGISTTASLIEHQGGVVPHFGTGSRPRQARFPAKPSPKTQATTQRQLPLPRVPPWTEVASYPLAVGGNVAVNVGGAIYSFGGYDSDATLIANNYVYQPALDRWDALAPLAAGFAVITGAAIGEQVFLIGYTQATTNGNELRSYDVLRDQWTQAAMLPSDRVGSVAVALDGKLYVLANCADVPCMPLSVLRYDPATKTWETVANYPEPSIAPLCGAIEGRIYCTGGSYTTTATYVYDPALNRWDKRAALPYPLLASAVTVAHGRLWVSGGISNDTLTNQTLLYDPAEDRWTTGPGANSLIYSGGAACGFYRVGGYESSGRPTSRVELLPGLNDCAPSARLSWMHTTNATDRVALPHTTVTSSLIFDSKVAEIAGPGDYTARLSIHDETPYQAPTVPVTFTVLPPSTWGKLAGTVTGLGRCDQGGAPIEGATILLAQGTLTRTLSSDPLGGYSAWFDPASGPISMTVQHTGYGSRYQSGIIVSSSAITNVPLSLRLDQPCLQLAPAQLTLSLVTSSTLTQTLTISNAGAAALSFQIDESPYDLTPNPSLQPQPAAGGWYSAAPHPTGTAYSASTQCMDDPDHFYLVGGNSAFGVTNSLWRYEASSNTWHEYAPIPNVGKGMTAVCAEGAIYVFGGAAAQDFQIYTIAQDAWHKATNLPRPGLGAAVATWRGQLIFAGGYQTPSANGLVTDTIQLYTSAGGTWTTAAAPLPVAVAEPSYTQVGSTLYLVGGLNELGTALTATQRLDLETLATSLGPPFSVGRTWNALIGTDRALYAIGGKTADRISQRVERLDYTTWTTGTWQPFADDLPEQLANSAAFCSGSPFDSTTIWAIGGQGTTSVASNSWFHLLADEQCGGLVGAVPWLNIETGSSTPLAADSRRAVTLTVDTHGLAVGSYRATLIVRSSDREVPVVKIPVWVAVVNA